MFCVFLWLLDVERCAPRSKSILLLFFFGSISKRLNNTYMLVLKERNWVYVDLLAISCKK